MRDGFPVVKKWSVPFVGFGAGRSGSISRQVRVAGSSNSTFGIGWPMTSGSENMSGYITSLKFVDITSGTGSGVPEPATLALAGLALAGLAAAVVLVAAIGYGHWRIQGEPRSEGPALDVLLVQGSIDTELKHDPDAAGDVARHYDELTMAALDLREGPAVGEAGPSRPDLIVWPETMWRWGLLDIDPDEVLPESVVAQTLAGRDATGTAADRQAACRRVLEQELVVLGERDEDEEEEERIAVVPRPQSAATADAIARDSVIAAAAVLHTPTSR
jgi:hypothetical protein